MKTLKPTYFGSTHSLVAIVFCLFLSLNSCGIVHKLFTRQKQTASSHSNQSNDSTGLKKSDQLSVVQKDSTALAKKTQQADAGVEIIFSDTSSQNGVQITIHKSGKQTLTATGAIQSVKTRGGYSLQSQDSIHTSSQTTTANRSFDSSKIKSATATGASSSNTIVNSQKSSWQFPWYGYFFLFLLVILAIGYWRHRQTIKRLLP